MSRRGPPIRIPASCKRGPDALRPILGLPPEAAAPSALQLRFGAGLECTVPLPPRYTAFILAVVDAWNQDDGELEALRGYRSAAQLGERYAEFSHAGLSITEETVRAYIYEIKVRIAEAVSSLQPVEGIEIRAPRLFEGWRVLGYRIDACGLEIVQVRARAT